MYAAGPRGRCVKSGRNKPARFCPLLPWYTDRAKRSGVLFVLLWFSIFGGSARKRALPSVWFLTGRNHEPAADTSLAAGTDALGNRDNVWRYFRYRDCCRAFLHQKSENPGGLRIAKVRKRKNRSCYIRGQEENESGCGERPGKRRGAWGQERWTRGALPPAKRGACESRTR